MNHIFDDESREARFFSFDPDPHGAHVKILKLVGRNKKVLDVGCAHGHLSKKFKENGCFVIGIEIDSIAAEEARKIGMMLSWVT